MTLTWIDWLGLLSLAALLEAAILVFIKIQTYLNDPHRHERNEEWFAAFHRNLQHRYADKALRWRVEGISRHFHRDES